MLFVPENVSPARSIWYFPTINKWRHSFVIEQLSSERGGKICPVHEEIFGIFIIAYLDRTTGNFEILFFSAAVVASFLNLINLCSKGRQIVSVETETVRGLALSARDTEDLAREGGGLVSNLCSELGSSVM